MRPLLVYCVVFLAVFVVAVTLFAWRWDDYATVIRGSTNFVCGFLSPVVSYEDGHHGWYGYFVEGSQRKGPVFVFPTDDVRSIIWGAPLLFALVLALPGNWTRRLTRTGIAVAVLLVAQGVHGALWAHYALARGPDPANRSNWLEVMLGGLTLVLPITIWILFGWRQWPKLIGSVADA